MNKRPLVAFGPMDRVDLAAKAISTAKQDLYEHLNSASPDPKVTRFKVAKLISARAKYIQELNEAKRRV